MITTYTSNSKSSIKRLLTFSFPFQSLCKSNNVVTLVRVAPARMRAFCHHQQMMVAHDTLVGRPYLSCHMWVFNKGKFSWNKRISRTNRWFACIVVIEEETCILEYTIFLGPWTPFAAQFHQVTKAIGVGKWLGS